MERQCKQKGIGKCNSERGTHDNWRKNGKEECYLKRANVTWKEAHLTNEEDMDGTNASWKEATWKMPNAAHIETAN